MILPAIPTLVGKHQVIAKLINEIANYTLEDMDSYYLNEYDSVRVMNIANGIIQEWLECYGNESEFFFEEDMDECFKLTLIDLLTYLINIALEHWYQVFGRDATEEGRDILFRVISTEGDFIMTLE